MRAVGHLSPDGRGFDVDYLIDYEDPDCGAPPGSALAAARRAVRRLGWEPENGFSPVPDPNVTVIGEYIVPTWLVDSWAALPPMDRAGVHPTNPAPEET